MSYQDWLMGKTKFFGMQTNRLTVALISFAFFGFFEYRGGSTVIGTFLITLVVTTILYLMARRKEKKKSDIKN